MLPAAACRAEKGDGRCPRLGQQSTSRRARPNVNSTTSTIRIIRLAISVKHWREHPPSVEAARPAGCPGCGAASRPTGGNLAVHGHGTRPRQVRGPSEVDHTPTVDEVAMRRYRCQRCGAVIAVVPSEIMPRRLYTASAIAWALGLYGLLKESTMKVRTRVCPWRIVGLAATGWITLRRWIRAVRSQSLWRCIRPLPAQATARMVAERAATTLAAHAPPQHTSGPICAAVFAGAMHAR